MQEFGLLVSFPDGSPSFVNGYEAGMIWEAMQRGDDVIERTVHAENIPVLRRMATVCRYEMHLADTEFIEWNFARFDRGSDGGTRMRKPAASEARL